MTPSDLRHSDVILSGEDEASATVAAQHHPTCSSLPASPTTSPRISRQQFRFPRFRGSQTTTSGGSTPASKARNNNNNNPVAPALHSTADPSETSSSRKGSSRGSKNNHKHSLKKDQLSPYQRAGRRIRAGFPLIRIRLQGQQQHQQQQQQQQQSQSLRPQQAPNCSSSSTSSTTSTSGPRETRQQEPQGEEDEESLSTAMRCTKIVSVLHRDDELAEDGQVQDPQHRPQLPDASNRHRRSDSQQPEPSCSCATAILQHSYLEMVCGTRNDKLDLSRDEEWQDDTEHPQVPPVAGMSRANSSSFLERRPIGNNNTTRQKQLLRRLSMPDDPTVQESIECVFASQLQEGLPLYDYPDDDDDEGTDRDDDDDDSGAGDSDKFDHLCNPYSFSNEPINAPTDSELASPAPLMQSRQKSRTPLLAAAIHLAPAKRKSHPSHVYSRHHGHRQRIDQRHKNMVAQAAHKHYRTAKMVYVGTIGESVELDSDSLGASSSSHKSTKASTTSRPAMDNSNTTVDTSCSSQPAVSDATATSPVMSHCYCHDREAPFLPPECWPQRPLLFRPTPGSGVTVKGLRLSGSREHFWTPADGGWWLAPLYQIWNEELPPHLHAAMANHATLPICPSCTPLPINNGNEKPGEAIVVDFETPLFDGSLLLRLRYADGHGTMPVKLNPQYNDDDAGYFAGLNRRFQVIIRGRFKESMPMTSLMSGLRLRRPWGRLPPKWVAKSAVKVLSFFAPQIQVEFEDSLACPTVLAPLGSTPQTLIVQKVPPSRLDSLPPLDQPVEEPHALENTVLGQTFPGSTSLQRARGRKKAFDKLFTAEAPHPTTRTDDHWYTFEFLQHLINFQDFSVDLGSLLGQVPMAPALDGQPYPIMATTKDGRPLWAFDVWHQDLIADARRHDDIRHHSPKKTNENDNAKKRRQSSPGKNRKQPAAMSPVVACL